MKKEHSNDKLIKRFYGIAGPLDEYRKKEVLKIGNVCYILLVWTLLLINILAISLANRFPELIGYGYPLVLLIILLAFMQYIAFQLGHKQVDALDLQELSHKERKSLKGASIKFALYFMTFMYIWNIVFKAWMDKTAIFENLINLRSILSAALGGIFVGIAIHILLHIRIKKGERLAISPITPQKDVKWKQQIIKRFYGIKGPLDEYRQTVADKIGGIALIYLAYFLLVGNAIAFFFAIRYTKEVATIYPIIVAVFSMVQISVSNFQTLHTDINFYEFAELSPEEKRIPQFQALRWGVAVTILSTLFSAIADLFHLKLPFLQSVFHSKCLFFGTMMGLFTGLAMTAVNYCKKLEIDSHKEKHNE